MPAAATGTPPAASTTAAGEPPAPRHVHGDKGVYYAGCWVDVEDLGRQWCPPQERWSGASRVAPPPPAAGSGYDADVVVIGAGCVGAAIARELSRYALRVVLLERSDDVTQGATKGNSGIVHAGYDDTPGSIRAKLCWKGNQMFTQLDRELRFGLQRNGSLVVARGPEDEATLRELLERGRVNGVERLRIVGRDELRVMEPHIHPAATAALYSPDAATLTPYEFAIALAENAVDNGVELRLQRSVVALAPLSSGGFAVSARVVAAAASTRVGGVAATVARLLPALVCFAVAALAAVAPDALRAAAQAPPLALPAQSAALLVAYAPLVALALAAVAATAPLVAAGRTAGSGGSGGGGADEVIRARYVVNAAGIGAEAIAALVGDASFKIKPRLGEYLLLHKKEGSKARHILFPAPGKMGKGVLVQTTLWGNLILGPTAADVSDPATATRRPADIMTAILARCRDLVPDFDAREVIHSFSGARAKSSRGDWVIERSAAAPDLIHAAGIDSPGLAGSPAIALEVLTLLRAAGLSTARANARFNPNRRPIIVPKDHVRWTAAAIRGDGTVAACKIKLEGGDAATNVVCKCEKVTEAELVDALHRSLPAASTQALRKRTRAGMGHCQGEYCEERVRAVIAHETHAATADVPGRPWPASSFLPARWLDDAQRDAVAAAGEPQQPTTKQQ